MQTHEHGAELHCTECGMFIIVVDDDMSDIPLTCPRCSVAPQLQLNAYVEVTIRRVSEPRFT